MNDIEQGFHDALRRIDVMDVPVPPIDPAALATQGSAVRTRRHRLQIVLAAAAAAAVAVGAAGYALRGQAGPPVVGVPAPSQSQQAKQTLLPAPSQSSQPKRTLAPAPAEASTAGVVVRDASLAKRTDAVDGPRSFFVNGDTVYLFDSRTNLIYLYRSGSRVASVANPMKGILIDIVVRDGVWYLVDDEENFERRLAAYTLQGSRLVASDVLPEAAAKATDVLALLVYGQSLIAEREQEPWVLVTGPGPVPSKPTIGILGSGKGVAVSDGSFQVDIRTRHADVGGWLVARESEHVWYAVLDSYLSHGANVPQTFVYEFTHDGTLVATYTCPVDTRQVPEREISVADGVVYQLRVTDSATEVVRLASTPASR